MAEKVIQLHKADDTTEMWFPKTYTGCISYKHTSNSTIANNFGFTDGQELDACFDKIYDKIPEALGVDATNGSTTKFLNEKGAFTTVQSGSGTVSGTQNKIAKFTNGTTVGDSHITETTSGAVTTVSVDGNITATGNIVCLANSSDKRLKTDVEPFKGLDIVDSLNFVKFKWNDTACALNGYYKNDDTNYGVIAQDSDGVIDGFVFDMAGGYKGVRYEKLIPIMAQAIKELKAEVEELKKHV